MADKFEAKVMRTYKGYKYELDDVQGLVIKGRFYSFDKIFSHIKLGEEAEIKLNSDLVDEDEGIEIEEEQEEDFE